MSMFPAITVAGTGLDVDSMWIDTIGGNVANANDAVAPGQPAYQDQGVDAAPVQTTPGPLGASEALGVEVTGISLGSSKGVLVPDPTSPLANKAGMVEMPDVSISHELVSLVEAQTSFQANSNVLQNSDNAYKSILDIKA